MINGAWVHILLCADGSYYVGSTTQDPDVRTGQHNDGTFGGYTSARRPVKLIFQEDFPDIVQAKAFEYQVKRWSRAKKEALIRRDWDVLQALSRRRAGKSRPTQAS
ncbi:MAG: GIY-YIG nuclease family protein [Alphaproteobacteria bacterium]|nr:GIY-YIG nuclease family protein [Alphaproteobacteria bacterium]